jgi:hypothetical protein
MTPPAAPEEAQLEQRADGPLAPGALHVAAGFRIGVCLRSCVGSARLSAARGRARPRGAGARGRGPGGGRLIGAARDRPGRLKF